MQRFRVGSATLLWFMYAASMSRKWKRATQNVSAIQHVVLKRIVSSNVDSEFGREHHFADVDSIEAYQHAVPLRSYEAFSPYIDRVAEGYPAVLTVERVRQFALTSGSIQASKLIPYTQALVNEFQEGLDAWVSYLFQRYPRLLLGKTYWSVTPVGDRKSQTPGGIPVGFDDEQAYFSPFTRWVLNSIMAVPSQFAQLSDMETFRYATLRLLLQEKWLLWISVWNPSFLSLLLDPLAGWFSQLVEDIRRGTLSLAPKIEASLRDAILACCKGKPGRAAELEALYAAWRGKAFTEQDTSGRTLYEAIWPHLQLISCWASGNAVHALPQPQAYFPHAAIQPKGLLATEAFISFPFSPLHPSSDASRLPHLGQVEDASALSLLSHFFEFEDIEETSQADRTDQVAVPIKLAHELEVGRKYSVIVTTGGGLYRYRLNDLIEVVDFYYQCPLIRFIGRQSKVVYLCGEKLNEEFVRTPVTNILIRRQLTPTVWMMAPAWANEIGTRPYYTLFIQFDAGSKIDEAQLQSVVLEIDEAMQGSYHYEYSRRLGQLDRCRLFVVAPQSDAFHIYLAVCTDLGQRLGDIKPVALHAYQKWSKHFTGAFV